MIKEIEDTIVALKKQIDREKEELIEVKGRKKEILRRLKSEFKLSNLSEAEEALGQLNAEIKRLEEELEEQYEDFKSKYNHIFELEE